MECGIVCDDRVVVSKTLNIENASLHAMLPDLEALIRSFLLNDRVHSVIEGIGVGICVIVDKSGSVVATNGKYDDAVGFNFRQWVKKCFDLPCAVENDTRLALLGEHYAGAAQGYDDAVLLTLGTGIGGAVMLGGKLLQSQGGRAGGLAGHLGVDWLGRICSCGNRGCAEAEASTACLTSMCQEWNGFAESALTKSAGKIDFRRLYEAADCGDCVAQDVLEHCIGVWSALTVTLIHAYDPRIIVFGGSVMKRHETILPRIREHVHRHAWLGNDTVAILPTTLGPAAALLGALPLLQGEL